MAVSLFLLLDVHTQPSNTASCSCAVSLNRSTIASSLSCSVVIVVVLYKYCRRFDRGPPTCSFLFPLSYFLFPISSLLSPLSSFLFPISYYLYPLNSLQHNTLHSSLGYGTRQEQEKNKTSPNRTESGQILFSSPENNNKCCFHVKPHRTHICVTESVGVSRRDAICPYLVPGF